MQFCPCRRDVIFGSASLIFAGPATRAQTQDLAALHAALRAADALDGYMSDWLAALVAALGGAMGVRATLNAPPGTGGIMVCVVRAARELRPAAQDMILRDARSQLEGSPVADPVRRVVWVSADFFRKLAVRISLLVGQRLSLPAVIAQSMLNPPPALPALWQPQSSPALQDGSLLNHWLGAGSFVLAHELGHVLLGPPPPRPLPASRPNLPRFASQLAPMCPALYGPEIAALRGYEERADQLAMRATQTMLAHARAAVGGSGGMTFELGVFTLLLLVLGENLVSVAAALADVKARGVDSVERLIGPEDFARLRAQVSQIPVSRLVEMVYSDTHPAAVERLLSVQGALAQQPESRWYGERAFSDVEQMWRQLIDILCAQVAAMPGPPR